MTAAAAPRGNAGTATGPVAKQGRGKQFWTVENLTSAPLLLTVATVLLCLLGLMMVFSASSIELVEAGKPAWKELMSQATYLAISVAVCIVVRRIGGSPWVDRIYLLVWAAVIVLLVLVLFIGVEVNGAKRWLKLGFTLQPSELAKISVVMGAARIFDKWGRGEYTYRKALLVGVAYVLLPFALIVLQKDLGTLLIIGTTVALMAVLAGVRARYMGPLVILCIVAVLILIMTASYRSERFITWLDPYADYYGDGWQPIHGTYAFASGGFFGLGLGNSRQKYSYLPEAQNDYVYAIIGEELGFVGAFGVILLFVLWGWSGMRIAYRARSYSRVWSYMAAGLTVVIEVQALLNIGGVLGVIPLSGRTLPFISSGGSSILSCLIIVGLLLGVSRDCDEAEAGRRVRPKEPRPQLTVLDGGAPTQDAVAPDASGRPHRSDRSGRPAGGASASGARPGGARPRPERYDEPERRRR